MFLHSENFDQPFEFAPKILFVRIIFADYDKTRVGKCLSDNLRRQNKIALTFQNFQFADRAD